MSTPGMQWAQLIGSMMGQGNEQLLQKQQLDTSKDQKQQQLDMEKQDQLRRAQDADRAFAEHIQGLGALHVNNGTVKRQLDASTPSYTLPGGVTMPGASTPGFLLDKADTSRVVRHKTADGETIEWELPTPEEQQKIQSSRLMAQFQQQAPMRAAQVEEAADAAGQTAAAKKAADEEAYQTKLRNEGIDIDAEYANKTGLPPALVGKRLLPETVAALSGKVTPANIKNAGLNDRLDTRLDANSGLVAKTVNLTDQATGKQYQQITYRDGRVAVQPVVPTAGGAGAATPESGAPLKGVVKPAAGTRGVHGGGVVAGVSGAGGSAQPSDAKAIAQAIADGKQPPVMSGLYRMGGPVRAELARKGFNWTQAETDWKAVQKHLSTLNGPQQERLRQAIQFTYDSVDSIDKLYDEWSKLSASSGFKILNRAQLAAAKQLPGRMGEVATTLESQINDLTSELGTVYKGGNSSTDESLKLAASNLKADWNPQTFKRATDQIRKNLQIRRNSINLSAPAGVLPGSAYMPASVQAPPQPQSPALPQGSGKAIDKATAQQFYQAAGGDPNKARQLAAQSGWKVQ